MRPLIVAIAVIILICLSCNKEPETPTGSSKIMIGTTTIDSTSYIKVTVSAQVTSVGGNSIQQHGFCWGIASNPEISGQHSSLGSLAKPGKFSEQITGLTTNTKYYVRPYITYTYGTLYGQLIEATTKQLSKPTITTVVITDIKCTSAKVSANISADGGNTITKRGVCWNTTGSPSLINCIGSTNDGTGIGFFTTSMTNLMENTTYYAVAYATNSEGTAYSEIKQVLTLQLQFPQVTTAKVTNINSTSATCGGNVTSDGNGTVSVRGVCWNTTGNPTLANSTGHTTDGTGTGTFISNITGLTGGIIYYVTAYAANEKGTFYSADIEQFITPLPCGQLVVNYGGKNYSTLQIGTQCWIKENLNIGTRINGSQDQADNGTIEKYCYDDVDSNCNIYGGLYQWNELMQYITTEGAKGICPDGWHIPTDAEWTTLTTYLGGESVAGGKMKETGTIHWASPNTGATNSCGFTGLPGGNRSPTGNFFYILTIDAYFYSSSQYDADFAWSRALNYNVNEVSRLFNFAGRDKTYGYSARCVRDY